MHVDSVSENEVHVLGEAFSCLMSPTLQKVIYSALVQGSPAYKRGS